MTKQQREQEKINRAVQAEAVISNPVYQAAIQALRVAVYQQLSTVDPMDTSKIRELTFTLQNADKLVNILDGYYKKGKIVLETREKLANSTNVD